MYRNLLGLLLVHATAWAGTLPEHFDNTINSKLVTRDSLKPYVKPNEKITQILAIGDSYTAGIGSNGNPDLITSSSDCSRYRGSWPIKLADHQAWNDFNEKAPTLTFGACSGATMQDLINDQLVQGEPRQVEYLAIGKPQVAVMTIGGNDVGFAKVINDCIYRVAFPGDCQESLSQAEAKISSQEFHDQIVNTLTQIISAGRTAGGAHPPEAFQIYLGEYISFWNTEDPGCNDISWNMFWVKNPIKLDTTLRKRMNDLVDLLNNKMASVAGEMSNLGVFHVSGIQAKFDGHRFCEPGSADYLKNPTGADTWFWSWGSGGWGSGSEGDASSTSTDGQIDLSKQVVGAVVTDPTVQATVNDENPPWNVSPAFNSDQDLSRALKNVTVASVPLDELTRRIFHPKGTAYGAYADAFMSKIKANRPEHAPSFAPGTCCFHVDELETCDDVRSNLFARVKLVDNNKNVIYETPRSVIDANRGIGQPINDGNGAQFQGPLPYPVDITGEHQNDYIQFGYNGVMWTSGTKDGAAHCSTGGWDPRKGPWCQGKAFQGIAKRQMDCCFPC